MCVYGVCVCMWVHECVHVCMCVRVCACTYVCTHHIFFIHLSVDIQVVAVSWLLWIALLWAEGCMYLFELWSCLDMCPGVGWLVHVATLFLVFWGTSILFSIVAVRIYLPTNSVGVFSTPSLAFVVCRLFTDGPSDWYEGAVHCSLVSLFSHCYWCWACFFVPVGLMCRYPEFWIPNIS